MRAMFLKLTKFVISSILFLMLFCACKDDSKLYRTRETGTFTKGIDVNDIQREYILYVPEIYDSNIAVPLVLNFHGYTQSALYQMSFGDMRTIADTANFILVYPQGSLLDGKAHWNVGSIPEGSTSDDVGFTKAMLAEIASNYNIDQTRIYACGYSNGGCFSFELAGQLSNRIAAIGAVAGTMTEKTIKRCNITHPMPILTINGTADRMVKYDGSSPVSVISQQEVLDFWIKFNNTDLIPIISNIPDTNHNDGSTVQLTEYLHGDREVEVVHYKVFSGGHDWPGKNGNMDINSSSIIWNFVSKFDINGRID